MTATIIVGQDENLSATVQVNGSPVAINTSQAVNASLLTLDGQTTLAPSRACDSGAAGADWSKGVVVAAFTSIETGALIAGTDVMMVLAGPGFVKRFRVHVENLTTIPQSLLFIRDMAVDELRQDNLVLMAQTYFPGFSLTDDFIWDKVKAAESEIARDLRVPLVPIQFFPNPFTDAQLVALPSGMPWAIDPAYDYDPDFFQGEKWGFMVLRKKPIVGTPTLIRFVYPAPTQGFYDIPADWLRLDRKYAHIRFVPASSPFVAPLNAFILQALGGGRSIPFAIEVTYVAGLENAAITFPELIDAIKKKAILKIIEDGFLPQSGSISADGLSQSMSIDLQKYHGTVQNILYGPPGTNGGLMSAIHGIRASALGN